MIYITEFYQEIGKFKEAADMYTRMAGTIKSDNNEIKALFFEQASYEYLHMKQFRKFSFFM